METRALSIAFFFAVGTAAGGIAGPLLFGHLIASGSQDQVAIRGRRRTADGGGRVGGEARRGEAEGCQGAALSPRAGPALLGAGDVGQRPSSRRSARPRGRGNRQGPARARQRQPSRAWAPGRRPLLGPGSLPGGAPPSGRRRAGEAAAARPVRAVVRIEQLSGAPPLWCEAGGRKTAARRCTASVSLPPGRRR